MIDDPNERPPEGGEEYRCPQCGSEELAADAVEHKTVYMDAGGQVIDEASGSDTEFESFRCLHCGHRWGNEDAVVKAVRNIAAATEVAQSRLDAHELDCYHRVLDRLNDLAADEGNPLW